MKRIKMVLAVAAAMAVMVTAGVAPAMADNNNNNDRHLDRVDIRLDKQLLNQNNNEDFGFENGFFFSPLFFNDGLFFDNGFGFNSSCPFWGDTEGIVNQWDCFD